jgi:hypothetical protein
MKSFFRFACMLTVLATYSSATVMTFEGFAPPGNVVNVNPGAPYTEGGFTLTPSDANSAVFDSTAPSTFPGDSTAWFGFAADNTITLTGPAPFDLASALIGPSSIGNGNITFTIVATLFGGGTETVVLPGLTTATLETLNLTNLQSAVFNTSSDAGIDNITLNPAVAAPEPESLLLMGTGLLGLLGVYRRKASR